MGTGLAGNKFGRLTAVSISHKIGRNVYWLCRCDCGQSKATRYHSLVRGITKSCGCLARELSAERFKGSKHLVSHGMSHLKIYRTWQGMIERCGNPRHKSYKDYGQRGIKVCEWWMRFENFFADMGIRPTGKTLDRINANGNYEPANCRWATFSEQFKNRRPKLEAI